MALRVVLMVVLLLVESPMSDRSRDRGQTKKTKMLLVGKFVTVKN